MQSFSPPFGSTLTRLSTAEIAEYRAKLEAWQRPSQMLKLSRSLMKHMGDEDLCNQPGVDFITEAWAAAQFAIGRRARRVRLVSARHQWPDFEMRTRDDKVQPWEFTEVLDPRRRRGLEARKAARRRAAGKSTEKGVRSKRIRLEAKRVPAWLRRRCRAKVKKNYSGRVGLLIYLNWSDFGWHPEVVQTFPEATSAAKDAFTEVWVLWQTQVHRTWRNGDAAATMQMAPGTYDRCATQ